jgi:heterotetrameric sarcosine oxidase gamma subunit
VTLEFLSPSQAALARSPMERQAVMAGGKLEQRDGWNVAVRFDGEEVERERCAATVGFADLSHLGKVEVQAAPAELDALAGEPLELGRASRVDGVWWFPYTPERALAVCEPADLSALRERIEDAAAERDGLTSVIDVSSAFAALAIGGPLAREVFARFTALDLRDAVTPVRGFRPGSVARTPGAVLREAEARWLMLFGAALGQYMWTVVADAAESLGGGPVAADALPSVEEPIGADALRSVEGPIAGEASPRA